MRRPLIAGNWKMYKTALEGVSLAEAIRAGARPPDVDVLVIPPFTALNAVGAALRESGVFLGAQNMHWAKEGAFTGEVSPLMLKDAGCQYVLLGHSERRQFFAETDEGVGRKARAAFDEGLIPVVCVGEMLAERESSRTFEVVERQLEQGLRHVKPEEVPGLVVAYEPVWAIGTGLAATPEQAQEVHLFIRRQVDRSHGDAVAAAMRILYGGSVKPDSIGALMAQPDVDGALVGGACLKADSFLGIVNFPRS